MLNALSNSDVFVENRLFATLDTTTRTVEISPSTNILLTDTVGFIRKLPHHLVASFQSTLEEVCEADFILHVVDSSSSQAIDQIKTVNETLNELEVVNTPVIYIFNKIDLMSDKALLKEYQRIYSPSVSISASKGINFSVLQKIISNTINASFTKIKITLPMNEQSILGKLYDIVEVLKRDYTEDNIIISAKASSHQLEIIKKLISINKDIIISK